MKYKYVDRRTELKILKLELENEKNTANIDYLSMMSGVDLPNEDKIEEDGAENEKQEL